MRADLHLHTTASDGSLTPREVVLKAVELELDVIAITDHDTVSGIAPALAVAKSYPQLTVIPGVEINTDVRKGEVHILGYFIDYHDPKLNRSLEELRNSRYERGKRMVAKLAEMGVNIEWNRVMEIAGRGSVGRPHIAQAMVEKGYVASLREAFDKYIGHDGPAYIERKKIAPLEAVKLVLESGGLPVLAHPADIEQLGRLLLKLKKAGLVGIEIYYDGYATETISHLEGLALKHDLIACGGSDYHGLDGSTGSDMGSVNVPQESVEKLISLWKSRQMRR